MHVSGQPELTYSPSHKLTHSHSKLPRDMAEIRPFRGLRYSAAAGPLEDLVAPPYDVLSPEERNALAAKNPRNIVHVTLPEELPDDRSKMVKYARS